MARQGYPWEFRCKVLDLLEEGRSITDITRDLGVSAQSIYTWRREDRIDKGLESGLISSEHAELVAARKRISELEVELKIARRAAELLGEATPPKGGTRPSR